MNQAASVVGRFTLDLFGAIGRPTWNASWPDNWKGSYFHDLHSVWPGPSERGYRVAYRHRFARAIDYVIEGAPRGGRVLDLAAGQGNFSIVLAKLGYRVTWNDLREDLQGYVRLKTDLPLEFRPGNLFELPRESVGLFDAIVATEIIEHVAHPDDFLRQVAEFLVPGGSIVLTTPNGAYMRNTLPRFSDFPDPSVFESSQFKPDGDGHIFLLYPDEMITLANRAGLAVERREFFNNPLTSGHLKTRHVLPMLGEGLVDSIEAAGQKLPGAIAQRIHLHTAALLKKAT